MLPDTGGSITYRWLKITIGAVAVLAVVLLLIVAVLRLTRTWMPPTVVPIPQSPAVVVNLEAHPRLIASQSALDSLAASTTSPEYILLMKKADQFYLEYKVDPKQGDTIYPGYFALAYRASGEQRYLEAARDMVINVAKFPRWHSRPESSNFYKIELAYAVGIAYDLLYDQFSPSERKKIETELGDVLDGLLWHMQSRPFRAFWVDAPNSNYYVAYHSAAGLLALCLGDTYPHWQEALAYSYDRLQPSIELFKKDGGWIEGLTYQDFAWGQHGLLFLNALRVNHGPNRLIEDWYTTSVRFALAGILPSGKEQSDFGDNISDPIASFGYLWRARAFYKSPFLDNYLSANLPEPDYPKIPLDAILIEILLKFDTNLPFRPFSEPPLCQHFPGIEWVTLRQDWTNPEGVYLAMKAGYGGWDHNHIDQGSMILAFAGKLFIADSGRGNFSDRRSADINSFYAGPKGHNVFIPAEELQHGYWDDFTMYSDNSKYRQADAKILDFSDTDSQTSFVMNLDGAYPSSGLKHWRRCVVWQKPGAELPGGAVMIIDDTDLPGLLNFVTPDGIDPITKRMVSGVEREGRTLKEQNGSHELGVWSWQDGKEIGYIPYEGGEVGPGLEAIHPQGMVIRDQSDPGLNSVITVLLPWDEIAHVVVGEDPDISEPFSVFVDGYLFNFTKDNQGNWRIH
jgi:hypothetical protein